MNIKFRALFPPKDWPTVYDKLGLRWVEDTKGIMAVDDDDPSKILAACILNNWTYSSVHVHFWIDSPMVIRAGFFHEVCRYVFVDAARVKMIGLVPANNEQAIRLDQKIGFKEGYRVKQGYMEDVDFIVFEATQQDLARWMTEEKWHGRKERSGRAELRGGGRKASPVVEGNYQYPDVGQPSESVHPMG